MRDVLAGGTFTRANGIQGSLRPQRLRRLATRRALRRRRRVPSAVSFQPGQLAVPQAVLSFPSLQLH